MTVGEASGASDGADDDDAELDADGGSRTACWVDVAHPDQRTLEAVGRRFGLHELAVEDASHPHQRPKLERYDDTVVIVAKPASYDDESETIDIGELLIVVGPDFVVSVRHGVACDAMEVADDGGPGEKAIERDQRALVVHELLDRVVDDYLPIAAELAVDIRQIEADVFSVELSNPSPRIYRLKRQVLELIRNVEPLIRPLDDLAVGAISGGREPVDEYFRDVADHARRLLAELQQSSALLSDVLQANLAQVSVSQNADMRRMSAWAAIFLVPTLLAGVWGMNFESMPELDWRFGYPAALAVMVATSFGLWIQFRRIGWLGSGGGVDRDTLRPPRTSARSRPG